MQKISPKAIKVWRIREAIGAAIVLLLAVAALVVTLFVWDAFPWWISLILFIIFAYIAVVHVWLLPGLKYKYFRFQVSADEIRIHQGIFFKEKHAVPLFRVQNIDTTVGPLMKRYGLKGVTLKTSAERIHIPELESDEADMIRNDIRKLINENTRRTQ
ncbi:PH domain-containing protein [Salinicoccus sp. ID82-1]|uniref:PH domain-containing protein n=1 Tax=Salinicoccus cyprini TaxID=2493691 RepID=A0A558ASH6_9STAP|nr:MULTISPECIES: PH domain-containing protein [Salinicoccus]MCG1009920.1 PH domain-containing protein [Salinicoccus sp. ID82-1]TVT27220.1 PH domain-containing protein [Salinicoccus cyprini]